jgi:hypothetical protein
VSSHSGGEQEAIDRAFHQPRDHFRLIAIRIAAFDHEVGIEPRRRVHAADQQFAEIGGGRVGIKQRDAQLRCAGKAARGAVGRVVELFDGRFDRKARFLAHARASVDHAADGHRRALGEARDVGHRGAPGLPTARSDIVHLLLLPLRIS